MRLPHATVELDKAGIPIERDQVLRALDVVRGRAPGQTGAPQDVLVMAHGWNNGRDAAMSLFTELGDNVAALAERDGLPAGRFAVLGIQWPSIRWADEEQIVGGGASAVDERVALEAAITERVEDPVAAAELRALTGQLDVSAAARAAFLDRLRSLVPTGTTTDDDAVPEAFLTGDPEALFTRPAEAELDIDRLDLPPAAGADDPGGGGALPPGFFADPLVAGDTAAAGLGLDFGDVRRMARRLLNYTTYYTMKERSRTVGETGLVPLLDQVVDAAAPAPVRLHLVGHSFGARLVTSAAARTGQRVSSLSLLQGAFSHRGFSASPPPGAFRSVLDGALSGPCIVTHTHNDKAVLLAYAIASRIAGQVSAGVGDPSDPYGGLGANGAVATDEADEGVLEGDAHRYDFRPGRIHNLRADTHVADHGDVRNREVANAVLHAVLTADRP